MATLESELKKILDKHIDADDSFIFNQLKKKFNITKKQYIKFMYEDEEEEVDFTPDYKA